MPSPSETQFPPLALDSASENELKITTFLIDSDFVMYQLKIKSVWNLFVSRFAHGQITSA